jgi:hypothetical protein
MSLFLQSMCQMGWRYAEENAEFVRFESGEGDRLVSFKIHAPYGQPVKVTFWTQATGDYTREFKSLPKIAGYADDPETFYDKLVADTLPDDPPGS